MSLAPWSPELIWGLLPRIVGFTYVLAFGALIPQHDVVPGASRMLAMRELRARVNRDFPGPRKYLEFPTLLWLADSDPAQRLMLWLGVFSGAAAIYGGPVGTYALIVGWLLWLSFEPRGMVFPWDTMLQEVGFLVLFLPAVHALPELSATAAPLPSVAFMMRWLLVRLMLGFAKVKFMGAKRSDSLYLRGFFVWMPLPSPLGWWAHHAPAWFLRASLHFMFLAEVVAPVLCLFTGIPRLVGAALLVMLMAGIQLTGNWGFFNVGYALLCVCLLDTQSSIFDLGREPWVGRLTDFPDLAVHLTMGAMFLVSLFYLVVASSWVTRSWVNWTPDLVAVEPKDVRKLWRIHRLFAPLRAIAPFRIVNGYGVFPPGSTAPVRLTPVFEGSDDGVTWKQYATKHLPSSESAAPPFIAPYHARLDQYLMYVPVATDSFSMLGVLVPMGNPYTIASRASPIHLYVQRLLAGDRAMLRMMGENPFPDAPPKLVRVGLVAMTPARPSELRATGKWWHVRRVATLIPATPRASWPERVIFPEPELFHPDLLLWKRRARPIKAITRAYQEGRPVDEAVLAGSDLEPDDLARFWDELVPRLGEARGDFGALEARAAALEERFGVEGLFRLERVLERYCWILRLVLEPHRLGTASPALAAMPNFRFHMLLHEVVADGRAALEAMLREPARIVERAERSTAATQLWVLGLMRYDQLMLQVQCLRLFDAGLEGAKSLPSFLEYYDFLTSIVPPGEEFRPLPVKHEDGEHTVEGLYPPPRPSAGHPRHA